MLKKKNQILLVAFVCCLTLGLIAQVAAETLDLNVQDAVDIAFEHNLNFQIASLDWQEARAKLERARIVGEEEMLAEAEEEWEKAAEVYEDKRQELQNRVRTSYQQLLESETMLENAKIAKERAESQLAMDENKYTAGLLSSLDIERAQNSLFDATYRLEKATIDLKTQRMRFNEILGVALEQNVVLTERLLLDFIPFTLSLETSYELALEIDPEVASAKEDLQTAKDAVALAESPFTPRVELEQALVNKEKAEIALQQAKQTLYFNIRADYYNLLDQAHALEVAERTIELERQTLKAEESKYAAGVLSNAEIVAAQESLAALEEQYSADLLNYSLARINFLQTLGRHEESGENNEN